MAQACRRPRSGIKRVFRLRGQLVADCLEVHVYRPSWKIGNTKSYSLVNISMSFVNAALRLRAIPRKLRRKIGNWMVKSRFSPCFFFVRIIGTNGGCRFYKSIEDGYTYANRTLLKLLMDDQSLIPRLRSLKHYFFLSQSSFLTHFLDLSASELRKPAKGVSIVKLQSLLDLALNSGEQLGYREDVKVTMANNGLYEWLLKVVSVSGAIGGEGGDDFAAVGAASVGAVSNADAGDETGKDKDKDKKQLQGTIFLSSIVQSTNSSMQESMPLL